MRTHAIVSPGSMASFLRASNLITPAEAEVLAQKFADHKMAKPWPLVVDQFEQVIARSI